MRMRSSSLVAVSVVALYGPRTSVAAPPVASPDPDADPMLAIDQPAAVHAMVPEGAPCLPRALPLDTRAARGGLELQLGTVDGAPLLCAIAGRDPPLGTVACWAVDVRRKTLAYRPPQLLPGELVSVKLAAGCTHGLCVPDNPPLHGDGVEIGVNDTGTLAMILEDQAASGELQVFLFDRTHRKLQRAVTLTGGGGSRIHTLFVGRQLVIVRALAGPMALPMIVPLDGNAHDSTIKVGRRRRRLAEIDLSGSRISLLRPGHVALIERGGASALDLDVAAEAGVELGARRPRYNPNAPLIATPTGYLAIEQAAATADLVAFDKRFRVVSRFSARCAK